MNICDDCRKKYYSNEEYLNAKLYEIKQQKTVYMCIHTYNDAQK